jgi:alpha-tubulin suppressor-like RCC1 family protein
VGALSTWLKLSGGYQFPLAIKTDGTLWTWGSNNRGELGLGNTTYYSSPKQIGALTTWLSTACGTYFGIATKSDGTLWTWGQNTSGQLGLGNRTSYSSPKQVGSLTTWSTPFSASTSTFVLG